MIRALAALALVAACSSPPPPVPEEPEQPAEPVAESPDAGSSIENLRLVAFAKVMEETDSIRHECWARGAYDDYKLSGRVLLAVTLGADGVPTKVAVEEDTTDDAVLTDCLVELYGAHRWPPVFDAGTTIKTPVEFGQPRGVYTVSVHHGVELEPIEGKLWVLPLLHAGNTGNPAASMSLMKIAGGLEIDLHRHPGSAELLYIKSGKGVLFDRRGKRKQVEVSDGSFIYLPAGKEHGFRHTGDEPVDLLQLYAPGGPEQRFFAGGSTDGTEKVKPRQAGRTPALEVVDTAAMEALPIAGGNGWVKLAVGAVNGGGGPAYGGLIALSKGVAVPAHNHPKETELLFIYKGAGTMTVDGRDYPVSPGTAVQVPPGVEHAFVATDDVEAAQFYTPSGPEQRFKPQTDDEVKR